MNEQLQIGDYVEHCSLMPGILMAIDGDDVEIRVLDDLQYNGDGFSNCSIANCDVRKLSYEQVKMMIALGKEKLSSIYKTMPHFDAKEEYHAEYDNRIKETYLEMMNDK